MKFNWVFLSRWRSVLKGHNSDHETMQCQRFSDNGAYMTGGKMWKWIVFSRSLSSSIYSILCRIIKLCLFRWPYLFPVTFLPLVLRFYSKTMMPWGKLAQFMWLYCILCDAFYSLSAEIHFDCVSINEYLMAILTFKWFSAPETFERMYKLSAWTKKKSTHFNKISNISKYTKTVFPALFWVTFCRFMYTVCE